jgi:hypothetical protein
MNLQTKDPNVIRKIGLESLTKGLGPFGMACFLRQYDMGEGNYTKEREELLKDISIEDVENELKALKNQKL